jgi:putative tricarboxylic transport membrane protein
MAFAFLTLGLFLFYQATRLSMRGLDGGPGPGLMPAGLGLLMVLISLRLVPSSLRERLQFGHLGRISIMVAALVVYALILERVGFVVATSLMMVVLLVAFNGRHRLPLAALGVVGTLLAFQLFYSTLKVQLPPDPWGLWR